jgi:hypothetical protein
MLELPDHRDLQAAVSSVRLNSPEYDGLESAAGHVVVAPLRRLDNGVGVYSSATVVLVKELRADGLNASFLDPPERRTFEVRKSAVADVVTLSLSVGGSLMTNTVWFYVERLLTRTRHGGSDSSNTELEIIVVDPLAPPECNRLVLRGKPDVVLRAAAEISRRNPPAPTPPSTRT